MKTLIQTTFMVLSISATACTTGPTNADELSAPEINSTDHVDQSITDEAATTTIDEVTPNEDVQVQPEEIKANKLPPPPPPVEEEVPVLPEKKTFDYSEGVEGPADEMIADELPEILEEIPHAALPEIKQLNSINAQFDQILKTYVNAAGFVDYAGLKKNSSELDACLALMSSAKPSTFNRNEGLAFWSNAYNAFTLKLMIDNYPLKSITDLKFGGKSAWDHVWITIDGKKLSLNQIENEIIRPKYKEPRIHFIINCASFSCPLLLNKALTASNIESIMTAQAKRFINDPKRNKISSKSAEVSKLFDWYAADFGDLRTFLNKYSEVQISEKAKISYMEYDWSLNKQ